MLIKFLPEASPFHRLLTAASLLPAFGALLAFGPALPAGAVEAPESTDPLIGLAFQDPALHVPAHFLSLAEVPLLLAPELLSSLRDLGLTSDRAFFDPRGSTWGTLLLSQPLVPGSGVGNGLTWSGGAPSTQGLEEAVRDAFLTFLASNAADLRLEIAEVASPTITIHDGGRLIQINARQVIDGVPVRGAFLTAVVNHGNLVLFGSRNWAPNPVLVLSPVLTAADAVSAVQALVGSIPLEGLRREPHLEIVPLAAGIDPLSLVIGSGYLHRLVWVVEADFAGSNGRWEGLVDALTGQLIAFQDRNHYASGRQVKGGVFPVSNDGEPPDGVEVPGFAMPFADVETRSGELLFTDSGGGVTCVDGPVTTRLDGRFVRMNDACGSIFEESLAGDLDLGVSGGNDCTVPPGSSPGNTHASRTGFYEVNRIKEMARGQLPGNSWLQGRLTSNMNIDADCNAFWDGSTINFYTSGGGCANTGEIAGIFDHEWGHGMDENDANPGISSPGEAPADIYAFLRLGDSCIGRGFRPGQNCAGNGDACLDCTGVREVDWAKHASGQPHDLSWINTLEILPGGGCIGSTSISRGPCGQGTHCEGHIPSETVWDLAYRDLQGFEGSAFDLDANTALELTTRLHYQGGGAVGNWYNCVPLLGLGNGCNADGGYLNFLAADDDNGDLTDGTPHMSAIFAAFDRHQIACSNPTVANSGCGGGPTAAPSLTATPLDKGAALSWSAVPGARSYAVYRTEGVKGCDFGKFKVAEVTGTEFTDSGLSNGQEVFYNVLPVGEAPSCVGTMSPCAAVTPQAGPSLALSDGADLIVLSGDGDTFIDNCESAQLLFEVENVGEVGQTGVRLVSASSPSHPALQVTTTLPAALAGSLAACSTAPGSLTFSATGIAHGEAVDLAVEVTSDQLAPRTVRATYRFLGGETDASPVTSRTWSFDGGGFEEGLDGWTVASGTFDAASGIGADGSSGFLASSTLVDETCDQVRSPLLRLTASSTLSLFNRYAIEPENQGWFDRANVGVLEGATGTRTTVDPDGGRLYNAGGPNGSCVTSGQNGWAGLGATFSESTWSAAALDPAGSLAGRLVQLDVAYGTDPLVSLAGFQFDEVTLTSFEELAPDGQSDLCQSGGNRPPAANDDDASTAADTPVDVAVLGNDADPDGDPLTVASVSAPANGTVQAQTGGVVTYTPDAGFLGTDSFTYTACDGEPLCDSALVTVTVEEVLNQAPAAADDSAITSEDTAVTIDLLANDADADGDVLTVTAVGSPGAGTAADNGDGTVTYTPDAGFTGLDSFTYSVNDGNGGSDSATVTVTVHPGDVASCTEPGALVAEDPDGDTRPLVDLTNDPTLDLLSLSMAEPFEGLGVETLEVILEVEDMVAPHPSAGWRVQWTSPDGGRYFVVMESCSLLQGIQCSYGTFNGTSFSKQGAAQTCAFTPDGRITIGVDKGLVGISDATDGGALLTGVKARTEVVIGLGCTGLRRVADDTAPESYGVYTNAACEPAPQEPSAAGLERVHGAGYLHAVTGSPGADVSFVLEAARGASGSLTGRLKVNDKDAGVKIDARQIESLTAGGADCNGEALGEASFEITAFGRFNGTSGARFRACGQDSGDPGQGTATSAPDFLYVECLSGCSYDTGSRTADDGLAGGNLHVVEALTAEGGSVETQSAASSSWAEPKVLEMEPMFLDAAPAGTEQLLAAVAYGADGSRLEGVTTTFRWTYPDGTTGAVNAVTDAFGVALTWVTLDLGDVTYSAEVFNAAGTLDSNRVSVTGLP